MSKFLLTAVLTILATIVFGQDWINLEYPMAGILGRPVDKVTYNRSKQANNINWKVGVKYDATPEVDTYESAESISEYQDKFSSFVTKYFNTDKHSVKNVKAYNLKVRSLSQTSVDTLAEGGKYIYEGIAADSVIMWIAVKKNLNIDISKAINDAATIAFNGAQSTELVQKILPLLDSISYRSNDSLYYRATIKSPNVYYKVKMIKLDKLINRNWEGICLYFFDQTEGSFPKTGFLTYDPLEVNSRTKEYYPMFWGRKDRRDVVYQLALRKVNNKLQLWLYGTNAKVNSGLAPITEIPFVEESGKRFWRMDRSLVYQFEHNKRIKKVLVQVAARQVDENTIEIINWNGNSSTCRNAVTYIRYPEFKATYTTK